MEFNKEEFAQMFEDYLRSGRGCVLYGKGIDLVHGNNSIPEYSEWFAREVFACIDHAKNRDIIPDQTLPSWMSNKNKVAAARRMGFLPKKKRARKS